jgi:hypothetical protein
MNENTFHGNVGKNPEINYGKNNGIAVGRGGTLVTITDGERRP